MVYGSNGNWGVVGGTDFAAETTSIREHLEVGLGQ
jgi:hypothetical protein